MNLKRLVGKFGISRLIIYAFSACIVCSLLAYSMDVLVRKNSPPATWTPRISPATNPTSPTLTTAPMQASTFTATSPPTNAPANTATDPPTHTPTSTHTPSPTHTPAPAQSFTSTPYAPNAECVPTDTEVTYANVIEITDGDTITIQFDDGTTASVRYIGMDTPESGDAASLAATNRNAELAAGKIAMLVKDVSEVDRFDRLLRYVIVQGVFINYELVRQGYAWAKSYPPDTACEAAFRQIQTSAQSAQIGIWAALPVPLPTVASRSETIDPGTAACSCAGNIYNCDAFSTHSQAQACFNYCVSVGAGDVHKLDGDGDGSACESLP